LRKNVLSRLPIKPFDCAVLALSIGMTLFSAFLVYAKPNAEPQVVIRGSGRSWVFPLNAEETVTIPGPLGNTLIELHEGRARVLSSPCVNQTCVAAGHIGKAGQWAACLPNEVFVVIEGSPARADGGSLDAAAW
jgi:hypothetical protein